MTFYILMLTFITSRGVALDNVPGFSSHAACVAAGRDWQGSLIEQATFVGPKTTSFLCVKMDVPVDSE